MVNVRCHFSLHSSPQDEITCIGAEQTGTSASNAAPTGGIAESSSTAALGTPRRSDGAPGS